MTGLVQNTRTDRVEGASFTVSFFNAATNGVVELVEGYDFSSSSSSVSSSSSSSASSLSSSSYSSQSSQSSVSSISSQSSSSMSSSSSYSSPSSPSSLSQSSVSNISSQSSSSMSSSTMILTSSSVTGPADYYFVVSGFGEGNGFYSYIGTGYQGDAYGNDPYYLYVGSLTPGDMWIALSDLPEVIKYKYYSYNWITSPFSSAYTTGFPETAGLYPIGSVARYPI